MAGRVAVVVLLVGVFVGALGLASARDCVEPDVVVKEGREYELVYLKNETQPQNATSTKLYVKPGGDFKGVCVEVQAVTPQEVTVVAKTCVGLKKCNLSSTTWHLLKVEAKVVQTDMELKVEFNLTVDDCGKTESESYDSENIARLSVTAKGASEWLHNASEYQSNGPPDACPDTTTENPSSGSLTVIIGVIVAAAVAVVAVAVAVGVVIWKRQRRLSAPQRVLRCIQSTSRGDTDTRYSGQVVENSLYEPLPGPVTPAARQQQPGTVQVIENTLYEPLPCP